MSAQSHPKSILVTDNSFAPRYLPGERILVCPVSSSPHSSYRVVQSVSGKLWIGRKDQKSPISGETYAVVGRLS